jgi:hypothetical protein
MANEGRSVQVHYTPVRNRRPVSEYDVFDRIPRVVKPNPNLVEEKMIIKPWTRAQREALLLNVV